MKRNVQIILASAAIFFANTVHADFTFHSNDSDACEKISGLWEGTGKGSNWLIGDCVYHGTGNISALDSSGNFEMDVVADKNSGSFICPKHVVQKLRGVCFNDVVTIQTEYGNLAGNFSQNTGNANGTLTVTPGITADIDIQFQRAR